MCKGRPNKQHPSTPPPDALIAAIASPATRSLASHAPELQNPRAHSGGGGTQRGKAPRPHPAPAPSGAVSPGVQALAKKSGAAAMCARRVHWQGAVEEDFVRAVDAGGGVERAQPKQVLELMQVGGAWPALTKDQVSGCVCGCVCAWGWLRGATAAGARHTARRCEATAPHPPTPSARAHAQIKSHLQQTRLRLGIWRTGDAPHGSTQNHLGSHTCARVLGESSEALTCWGCGRIASPPLPHPPRNRLCCWCCCCVPVAGASALPARRWRMQTLSATPRCIPW